jgi:hypothetical protein
VLTSARTNGTIIPKGQVVAASIFTTLSATAELEKMRAQSTGMIRLRPRHSSITATIYRYGSSTGPVHSPMSSAPTDAWRWFINTMLHADLQQSFCQDRFFVHRPLLSGARTSRLALKGLFKMSFEESPDYHAVVNTTTMYLVRLQRVSDKETRLGDALLWEFTLHDRADGTPVMTEDDHAVIINQITSPRLGPKARARQFVNKLFGRELPQDELRTLVRDGSLANLLKGRQALAHLTFEDSEGNEGEYPKIKELYALEVNKGNNLRPPPAAKRSYEEVFETDDEDDSGAASDQQSDGHLPFR